MEISKVLKLFQKIPDTTKATCALCGTLLDQGADMTTSGAFPGNLRGGNNVL